jgi:hypothetical protein
MLLFPQNGRGIDIAIVGWCAFIFALILVLLPITDISSPQHIVGDKNRACAPVTHVVSAIKPACIVAACKNWYRINTGTEGGNG